MAEEQLVSRNLRFAFDQPIPKNWLDNNPVQSHVVNSLNLLFPAGEKYFIRAVHGYSNQIQDQKLRDRIKGFASQEAQHGHEHQRFFAVLRKQGFQIDSFLHWYEKIAFQWIEKITPKKIRLAKTAAIEHYTACLGQYILQTQLFRKHAFPVMADFFSWHAAEEIEHKSVAYDVLIAAGSNYLVRIIGLLWGSLALGINWIIGVWMFLRQDPEITPKSLIHFLYVGRKRMAEFLGWLIWAFVIYLKPGFHPSQIDNQFMAESILEDLEARYLIR